VADETGADRTGFRISPGNPFNDIAESDIHEPHPALVRALAPLDLVERVGTGAPLNTPCPTTFYGGGEPGRADCPTHTA